MVDSYEPGLKSVYVAMMAKFWHQITLQVHLIGIFLERKNKECAKVYKQAVLKNE